MFALLHGANMSVAFSSHAVYAATMDSRPSRESQLDLTDIT